MAKKRQRRNSRSNMGVGRPAIHPVEVDIPRVEMAIRDSGGFITKAADILNVSLNTLKLWLKKYSKLRDALFETREHNLDVAEESLMSLVVDKNVTATIFMLKCLGKERGYIDVYKPGSSPNVPLFIRFLPATQNSNGTNGKAVKERVRRARVVNDNTDMVSLPLPKRERVGDIVDAEFSNVSAEGQEEGQNARA